MADLPAVNTSPLLYLSRAGLLDLLRIAGPMIAVPEAVLAEISVGSAGDKARQIIENTAWIQVVPNNPVPALVSAWDLGPGESAVLAYSMKRPGTEAIVDDLAARRCAASLNIPVRGTLGLVLAAKKRGIIPVARPAIQQLLDAGMYLSERTIDSALAIIGE